MKIKNFSLIKFSKTTDLSFLASAQIPTFCRESTKINQERTKGKGMPTLHLAYIKSSARLVGWSYVTFGSLSLFMQTKHYQSSIRNVSIGHSMIVVIFGKYHAWYFEIVTPNGSWNLRQFWNIISGIYAKYHVQFSVKLCTKEDHFLQQSPVIINTPFHERNGLSGLL